MISWWNMWHNVLFYSTFWLSWENYLHWQINFSWGLLSPELMVSREALYHIQWYKFYNWIGRACQQQCYLVFRWFDELQPNSGVCLVRNEVIRVSSVDDFPPSPPPPQAHMSMSNKVTKFFCCYHCQQWPKQCRTSVPQVGGGCIQLKLQQVSPSNLGDLW
jgi:hypothetical protein